MLLEQCGWALGLAFSLDLPLNVAFSLSLPLFKIFLSLISLLHFFFPSPNFGIILDHLEKLLMDFRTNDLCSHIPASQFQPGLVAVFRSLA